MFGAYVFDAGSYPHSRMLPPLQDAGVGVGVDQKHMLQTKVSSSAVFGIFPQHLLGCQIWTFSPQIPFLVLSKRISTLLQPRLYKDFVLLPTKVSSLPAPPKKKRETETGDSVL